jgi:hypothetical protein
VDASAINSWGQQTVMTDARLLCILARVVPPFNESGDEFLY